MKALFAVVSVWLVLINVFAYFSVQRFNLKPDTAYTWLNPTERFQRKDQDLLQLRVHWDAEWYLRIVNQGYQFSQGEMSSIAFFPLYPLLIWILAHLAYVPPAVAGWVISTLALYGAAYFLYKLVKEFHKAIDPLQPIILLLIFPTAFFLNSIYTEALFLLLSIAAFYYLLKKDFLIAAVFISLASVTRVNGLFLLIPFLIEYFRAFGIKHLLNKQSMAFLIAPLGFGLFSLYQYLHFGNWLSFLDAQKTWGRNFSFNPEHFTLHSHAAYANLITDLLFLATCIIAAFIIARNLRFSYGVYMLITMIVAVATGTLMSVSRFSLILFPLFIWVASIKNEPFKFSWRLISTLLLAVYTMAFVNDYWAG